MYTYIYLFFVLFCFVSHLIVVDNIDDYFLVQSLLFVRLVRSIDFFLFVCFFSLSLQVQ